MLNSFPQLAVGSHKAGSGKACIMNAISYINGDAQITDMPSCTHPLLARFAQKLNDTICTHRTGGLLCPDCSHLMWIYGARLIGTSRATEGWTQKMQAELSVKLARFAADQVKHLTDQHAASAADYAVKAAAYADAAAAYAAVYAAATAADYAVMAADAADAAAAYANYVARHKFHVKLVDEFYRLTGYTTQRESFSMQEVELVTSGLHLTGSVH